ncbi:MAG: peptide ABC transporter substrate-binding protein [Gammaproteobacteria bacterium]
MSRAAARQLLVLGAACVAAFALLLAVLSWAASATGGGAAVGHAVDVAAGTITTSIRYEPPNLDSTRATDATSFMVLTHVIEGLLRYDVAGNVVPGVAERWDIRPDGATFWLRADSVWSDGKPVTAHDFVFAWRTIVDPATASQYAFILYAVKNGAAINRGDLPRDRLGVHAVDDRTLEVEFENPIAYFDKLVTAQTYLPVREDFYRGREGRYAADVGDLLYNGPFLLTRWVHGASLKFEKNPSYWNRDAVRLNAVDLAYLTRDAVARLNLFQDGRIVDVDYLPGEALSQVLQQRWPLGRFDDGSAWFIETNMRPERVTRNVHLRRALLLANDPNELVFKVLKTPSYTPAASLFPAYIKGEHGLFRQEHPPPIVRMDLAAARAELDLAKEDLGMTEIPPLVLVADNSPASVSHTEYLQEHLRRTLGLTIKIDRQEFRQRLAKQEAGEFDITLASWGPDYDDPLTFADLFASWNLNNHARYASTELDAQVRIAQQSVDPHARFAAFAEVQRLLLEDAVIIPAYDRGVLYVQDPRLRGVGRRAVGGTPDYTTAYLVATP